MEGLFEEREKETGSVVTSALCTPLARAPKGSHCTGLVNTI